MKFHHHEYVYRTGSAGGYVDIEAPDKYTQKKFNYIKIIKDGDTYYLDKKGEVVKKAFATNFGYNTAHKIIMIMKANSTYNDCDITRYGTNSRLNTYTALCKKVPEKFLKKNTAAICHCTEIVTNKPHKNTQIPVPNVYVGMSVVHKTFGDGEIAKIGDRGIITVAFSDGEKELSLSCCFKKELLDVK